MSHSLCLRTTVVVNQATAALRHNRNGSNTPDERQTATCTIPPPTQLPTPIPSPAYTSHTYNQQPPPPPPPTPTIPHRTPRSLPPSHHQTHGSPSQYPPNPQPNPPNAPKLPLHTKSGLYASAANKTKKLGNRHPPFPPKLFPSRARDH